MTDDKAIKVGRCKYEHIYMTKKMFIDLMTADGNVTVEQAADDWDAMEKLQERN